MYTTLLDAPMLYEPSRSGVNNEAIAAIIIIIAMIIIAVTFAVLLKKKYEKETDSGAYTTNINPNQFNECYEQNLHRNDPGNPSTIPNEYRRPNDI